MNLNFFIRKGSNKNEVIEKNIVRAEGSGVIQGCLNRMHVGSAEGSRIVAFMM